MSSTSLLFWELTAFDFSYDITMCAAVSGGLGGGGGGGGGLGGGGGGGGEDKDPFGGLSENEWLKQQLAAKKVS